MFRRSTEFRLSVCSVGPNDDEDQQEKTLSQVYDNLPEGREPLDILKKQDERQCIGRTEGHGEGGGGGDSVAWGVA